MVAIDEYFHQKFAMTITWLLTFTFQRIVWNANAVVISGVPINAIAHIIASDIHNWTRLVESGACCLTRRSACVHFVCLANSRIHYWFDWGFFFLSIFIHQYLHRVNRMNTWRLHDFTFSRILWNAHSILVPCVSVNAITVIGAFLIHNRTPLIESRTCCLTRRSTRINFVLFTSWLISATPVSWLVTSFG